jgi:hypothetical protein
MMTDEAATDTMEEGWRWSALGGLVKQNNVPICVARGVDDLKVICTARECPGLLALQLDLALTAIGELSSVKPLMNCMLNK